jgi:helix-turn-helix protein
MPWKESSVMDERLRFIARLLEGKAMTDLCVEFGISRKTGYKIYDRYKQSGSEALTDRSKRPMTSHLNGYPSIFLTGRRSLDLCFPLWGLCHWHIRSLHLLDNRGRASLSSQSSCPPKS